MELKMCCSKVEMNVFVSPFKSRGMIKNRTAFKTLNINLDTPMGCKFGTNICIISISGCINMLQSMQSMIHLLLRCIQRHFLLKYRGHSYSHWRHEL
jgi:hypothetical protein